MRTLIAMAVILISGLTGHASMDDRPDSLPGTRPPQRRQVAVTLYGSAESISGMKVPKGLAHQQDIYLRVSEPAEVTVRLPGGKTVQRTVKYASINVDYDVVLDVNMLPLMEVVSYKEAVAALHRCLDEMGVEPDARMREQLAEWPEDLAWDQDLGIPPFMCRARTALSEDASLTVKARPAFGGGWFLVLTFSADGDARQAARTSAREAAKKPPKDEQRREDAEEAESNRVTAQ